MTTPNPVISARRIQTDSLLDGILNESSKDKPVVRTLHLWILGNRPVDV
jgi:hypothetical protein